MRRSSPPSRRKLASFPPLVFAGEARNLKKSLARVAAGEAFLLQGGDCAESFEDHSANSIRDFFRVFLQMSVVLTFAAASPVVKVGRIAGQFAKPRSSPVEKRDGKSSCRAIAATSSTARSSPRRRARPIRARLIEAYHQSAATLNLLRAFAHGGYASLGRVHQWMLGFVKDPRAMDRYKAGRGPHLRDARLHAGLRARSREPSGAARHRCLHQPRSAAARLRAGDDAAGFDHRRLVLHLGPHGLDRRPHAPARSRACGIFPRHQESDRPEMRALAQARRARPADRRAQSRQRAGPAHADLPLRRRQGGRPPAGAGARRAARGQGGGVVVRSDARQHDHGRRPATRRGRSTASCRR